MARRRVAIGFIVAAAAFVFARPSWRSLAVGVPIAMVGEGIRVWAAGHLVKGRELTTSGPYAITRHPLYVGSILIGIGFVVAAASLLVAIVVLSYLVTMITVAIILEEATLRAAFGDRHVRYITGISAPTPRHFSFKRVLNNREHQALIGMVLSVTVLIFLVWLQSTV